MIWRKISIAIFLIFSLCFEDTARAGEYSAYQGLADIQQVYVKSEEEVAVSDCVAGREGDEYCRPWMAAFAVKYLNAKDYAKARTFLDLFYKFDERMFGGAPCNFTRIYLEDNEYLFSYHSAMYIVDLAQKRKTAKATGLRAFLCESTSAFDGNRRNSTQFVFSKKNFIKFMAENYGSSPEFNGELYWDDIAYNVEKTYAHIRGGQKWGSNYKKDTQDSVKLTQLYENAARRCRTLGLTELFCSFQDEWSAYRRKISKEQALEGGLQ
jgi:hypothetical protein